MSQGNATMLLRLGWSARRRRGAVVCVALIGTLLAAGVTSGAPTQQALEGNPFRGRSLFVDKLCIECHSVWGHGGAVGPEIVRVVAGKSLQQLSGEFWNHTPRMIEEITTRGYDWPTIERDEMADLLNYLYYLRLFDDPGDPVRGVAIYERHRCGVCHALGGEGGIVGQPLDKFSAYTSPVPLAQAMWNEGPAMRQAQTATGTPIPQFSANEVVDLQAYIREHGTRGGDERVTLLSLPDPAHGEEVFRNKRCLACHGTGRAGAPDLGAAALRMSAAEISGILWNHSYAMQNQMAEVGIPFPRFRDNELADLISYLHLIGYRGQKGDASRGARVWSEKGCLTCHDNQNVDAPDLVSSQVWADTIALSSAMWNHAPDMHDLMGEHGVPWPKFEERDMEDLTAYLQQLSSRAPKAEPDDR